MKSRGRTGCIFIIVTIFFCLVILPGFLLNASADEASIFMDLERSVKELSQLVDRTAPSVVTVVAYDDSGAESGRGSGFFIDREGLIITNASFMKTAYSAEVLSATNYYDEVGTLNLNKDLDLALIQVKATGELPVDLDFEYAIQPGERVVVIGRASNSAKTVSEGLAISISKAGEAAELVRIKTTASIASYRPGKDGPLLNMAGKVIGVAGVAITENQDDLYNIPPMPDYREIKAVSLRSIEALFSGEGEVQPLHRAKSYVSFKWLIRNVKTGVFNGFIFLFDIGFLKLMAIVLAILLIIGIMQWSFVKLKMLIFNK